MPETQDTKNTTDQGRSGGMQTQESNRSGQGASAATNPDLRDQERRDPEKSKERFHDEMQRREMARDSKHPGNPAEEWSPGANQPNT
jgi:hypothetical protein